MESQISATAKPHVVILGAGPAGVGAAFQLTRKGLAHVTLLEECDHVGGIAGSFELSGLWVDYGSHRLHPSCDPEILKDIRTLLGDDLLNRPRHGRIKLCDRWIHFPLKPLDLVLRMPSRFAMGVMGDLIAQVTRLKSAYPEGESFLSVMETGLGRTICRDFYFPYIHKIWGLSPEELSVTQARRRVSANSITKMMAKVLRSARGRGHFFYPRHGFGQISEAYAQAAQKAGAEIHLNSRAHSVEISKNGDKIVSYEKGGEILSLNANHVWSTIPINIFTKGLQPSVPGDILHAAERISYRAMVIIYLVLEQDRFSEYDAHYFPAPEIKISRLSEPKNYSDLPGPQNLTVICAELPCDPSDPEWNKSDEELGQLVRNDLDEAGIPIQAPVRKVITRHFQQAYPIYHQGYEVWFDRLDDLLNRIDGLLTFGRQGLFAHDNTHHALNMAYCAVDCLGENGYFDRQRWEAFRRVFKTHVVED